MTRVIGHGRYAGEVYPSGAGGGGGAGASAVPLSRQRFIDGDTAQTGLNGSAAEPFKTIGQFMLSRGSGSVADSRSNYVGWVMPSISGYPEAVVFPAYGSTELRADSMSGVDGTVVTGAVTWPNVTGSRPASDITAVAALHNVPVIGDFTVTDDVGAPPSLVIISGDDGPGGVSAVLNGNFISSSTVKLLSVLFNNAHVFNDVDTGLGADKAVTLIGGGSIIGGDIISQAISCDDASIGAIAITVGTSGTGGFAQFHNTAFSGLNPLLTANVSTFDGSSWLSFLRAGGTRDVGTTVLVEGGYNGGAVEPAGGTLLPTGAGPTLVSLNGVGATAGYTGEHSGNHYTATGLTVASVVRLKTGGGELAGDTLLITKSDLAAFSLTVQNSAGVTVGVIPASARGFILATIRANTGDWVLAECGSLAA